MSTFFVFVLPRLKRCFSVWEVVFPFPTVNFYSILNNCLLLVTTPLFLSYTVDMFHMKLFSIQNMDLDNLINFPALINVSPNDYKHTI